MKQEAIERILNMIYPEKPYEYFIMRDEKDVEKQAVIDIIDEFVTNMLEKKAIWDISENEINVFRIGMITQNSEGPIDLNELAYTLEIPKDDIENTISKIKKTIKRRIMQRRTEYLIKKIMMDRNIDELELSDYAKNILVRIGKTTVGDIIKLRTTDFKVFKGNEEAKQEIIDKIHALGLIFIDEDIRTPLEKLQDEYEALKQKIERYNQEITYINKKRSIALDELEAKADEIRKEQRNLKTL